MIQNKRQYNVTKKQIETLSQGLEAAVQEKTDMDPQLYEAMVAGIRSQIDDLKQRTPRVRRVAECVFVAHEVFRRLRSRADPRPCARGLTQNELAKKLNLKPQQIQKYEATQYKGASLKRILDILVALDLDFEADVLLRNRGAEQMSGPGASEI